MTRSYNHWTSEDERTLRDMFDSGMTDEEIADSMDRSVTSVNCKRRKMRLLQRRGKLMLTDSQLAVLQLARKNGWPWERISEHTSIGVWSLRSAYERQAV